MCHSSCGGHGCSVSLVAKVLVIVGAVNWGLVGAGMLLGSDLNVVHMVLGSLANVESLVYVLVGVAGVMEIFGCKCGKCKAACAACGTDGKTGGGM
ncbi:hypothetical protein A2818_01425 [Candidatus Nomurabacteria bacterium RIFCSPHIGHO2_01_FULL_40_12]|uniref:DUF378 domain-containing protein n=1 Tax=Candidatus Nomurabacteria bacterium RIFCSPHIGHO2_01_FULL_40_12 TaxID=1801737 RepID=A0A1F6V1P1_9BACT|nr:MAG: hypothetical protein A2818_01425 [Candidatus Nomurabacteria bacterium RIFCSPHIGHO2_01_FULL_40_12]